MHNHDFDLIAQLAEGSLLGGDLTPAQDAVATCSECRLEFEAQTLALEALADVEPARMTEFERVRLHRAVAEAAVAPAPKAQTSFGVSWLPKLAVAAAAVAFVGVVGIGLVNLGGDDGAGDVAAGIPSTEAMMTEEAGSAAASEIPATKEGSADASAQAESSAGIDQFSTAALDSSVLPLNLGVIDRSAVDALTLERSGPGEVPERTANQTPLEPFPFACVGAAVGTYGEEPDLRLAGVAVYDGRAVEIFGFGDRVYVLDPRTCDLLFEAP